MNNTTIIIIIVVVFLIISSVIAGLYFGGVFGGGKEEEEQDEEIVSIEEDEEVSIEPVFTEDLDDEPSMEMQPPVMVQQREMQPPVMVQQREMQPPVITEQQEMGGYNTVSVTFKGATGNERFELLVNGEKFKSGKALKTYQTYTTKIKEPVVNVVIRRINDVPADYLTLKDVTVNDISIKQNVNASEWYPTDLRRRKAVSNGILYWRGDYIYTTRVVSPVNCKVSPWSSWGSCIEGTQKRNRRIVVQPYKGGELCPVLQETQNCGNKAVLKMKAEKENTFVDIYIIDTNNTRRKLKEKYLVKTTGDLDHVFYFTEDIKEFIIFLREWQKHIRIKSFIYNGNPVTDFKSYKTQLSLPSTISHINRWGRMEKKYRVGNNSNTEWAHHGVPYIFTV